MQRVYSGTGTASDLSELEYHVLLVRLMSISTEGKNGVAETTCQNLLTTEDVLEHLRVRFWVVQRTSSFATRWFVVAWCGFFQNTAFHLLCDSGGLLQTGGPCYELKTALLEFLSNVYLDTDDPIDGTELEAPLWNLMSYLGQQLTTDCTSTAGTAGAVRAWRCSAAHCERSVAVLWFRGGAGVSKSLCEYVRSAVLPAVANFVSIVAPASSWPLSQKVDVFTNLLNGVVAFFDAALTLLDKKASLFLSREGAACWACEPPVCCVFSFWKRLQCDLMSLVGAASVFDPSASKRDCYRVR